MLLKYVTSNRTVNDEHFKLVIHTKAILRIK